MAGAHRRPSYSRGAVVGLCALLGAFLGAWSEGGTDIATSEVSASYDVLESRRPAAPLPDRSAQRTVVKVKLDKPEPKPKPSPTKVALRHYNVGQVRPHVQEAANEIGTLFGVESIGGFGYRGYGGSDHPQGLALDFMVGRSTGDAIVEYVFKHRDRLRVTYVIWRQQINAFDGRGWRWMEDRGSTTANHYDHVHVSFK